MVRFLRYWYTYRTLVAVLIGLLISGSMYWLYTQQVACDNQDPSCSVRLSLHPEDRLFFESTDPNIVLIGIDDSSLRELGKFPLDRSDYATALATLNRDQAGVVAFDIGFSDTGRSQEGDTAFSKAIVATKIPVVLAYGSSGEPGAGTGQILMNATTDEIPRHMFRCMDTDGADIAPCTTPNPNVILASTDVRPDADGVVRKMPMFVSPTCYQQGSCLTQNIDTLGFAAYRAFSLQGTQGPDLSYSSDGATFGTTWTKPLPVDQYGQAIISWSGGPGAYKLRHQYYSFAELVGGRVPADALNGKIVMIGSYYLTGVQDEHLTPTTVGTAQAQKVSGGMSGLEIQANVVQMLLRAPGSFLAPEPPLLVLLIIFALGVVMALVAARLSVAWGLIATVGAVAVFTFGMAGIAYFLNMVPDLFHPWMALALTYTGVTAYRVLYEDRERRKVTTLFGQYLKPEIVAELAKRRGGADEIMRGGDRRDITLLFIDIRGFTSMSESMDAADVTTLIQMYLDHMSDIIFTWDGTIDKYVGDEIMALWNAPRDQPDHALLAVRCAYDMINRAPELQQQLMAKGLPPIRWGIGVNTGPAVVGNMGSHSRLQYTALGDTVNTAARFCANAPAYHLLIGQQTYDMCRDYIAVDLVPGVQLKGKSAETFRIYQVTAIRESTSAPWVQFPTEMASETHRQFTQQFTQKTILAAGMLASRDILVGTEAEQALAGQGAPTDGQDGGG
ncbi:MAG TPA: adenylate/guanylate cyclase domain-containing protein [Candidatus Dormibacteraeota bacterium]|nr:adenylate/guanylate cyclase domain-containing protein [Candidatus Dormibacteraeota bacterium]